MVDFSLYQFPGLLDYKGAVRKDLLLGNTGKCVLDGGNFIPGQMGNQEASGGSTQK